MSSACYYFELEDFGILGLIIDGPDWLLDLNRRRLAAENFDWFNSLIGHGKITRFLIRPFTKVIVAH